MTDIDGMTSGEIAAEIATLRKLASKDEITLARAERLSALVFASKRITHATRRSNWRFW